MTMLRSQRDMGGHVGCILVSTLLTVRPCRAAVKDYVSGRIQSLALRIAPFKTYLDFPDYC